MTDSALKVLEQTLLLGHVPGPTGACRWRVKADRSFARHAASEKQSQTRTRQRTPQHYECEAPHSTRRRFTVRGTPPLVGRLVRRLVGGRPGHAHQRGGASLRSRLACGDGVGETLHSTFTHRSGWLAHSSALCGVCGWSGLRCRAQTRPNPRSTSTIRIVAAVSARV